MEFIKVQYLGKVPQNFEKKYGTIHPGQEFEMELGDFMGFENDKNWRKITPDSHKVWAPEKKKEAESNVVSDPGDENIVKDKSKSKKTK